MYFVKCLFCFVKGGIVIRCRFYFLKEKFMKTVKLIFGLMLLPIAYLLFVLDRVITGIFFPKFAHPAFMMWCNVKYSTLALLRILVAGIIYGILHLIFG